MRDVYVVGGANIDIIGRSDSKLLPFDSNIGKVIQTYGGVGRNIAENIARLGMRVHFVSVLGDDDNGKNCIEYCESVGMDMSDCLVIEDERTSSYLAVLDDNGDMSVAINDMDILRFLTRSHIEKVFKRIKKEDVLVIDTNLDQELINYMMKHAPCPIYVDPISCKKASKLKDLLRYIHVFKPNIYEAEYLSGISYDGYESVKRMGQYFLQQGVKEVYISLGKDGVMAFKGDNIITCASEEVVVVNATGAGDSFVGAIVAASILEYDFIEKIKFAIGASVCTLETGASVCRKLSIDFVNKRREKLTFTIEEEK